MTTNSQSGDPIPLPYSPTYGVSTPEQGHPGRSMDETQKYQAILVCMLETNNPKGVFQLVRLMDLQGEVPELKAEMTLKDRCKINVLKISDEVFPCRIFAKIHEGVGYRIACYCKDKVTAAYKALCLFPPKTRHLDKYCDLTDRFLQDVRQSLSYPDTQKGESLEVFDWNSRHGVVLLQYLPDTDEWPYAEQEQPGAVKAEQLEGDDTAGRKRIGLDVSDEDSDDSHIIPKRRRVFNVTSSSEEVRTPPGSPPVSSVEASNVEEDVCATTSLNKRKKVPKKKRHLVAKSKCCTECKCWPEGGRLQLLKMYKDATSTTEENHMILIHQHLSETAIINKINNLTRSQHGTKEMVSSQKKLLEGTFEYSKTSAEQKKYDQQREADLKDLEFSYETEYQLKYHLENHLQQMKRAVGYVSFNDRNGNGCIQNFLKKVMKPSLLYRMYSATATSCVKTTSGRTFIFGTEYFRLPEKFQDLLTDFMVDRWPQHWDRKDVRKKILSTLQQHRKTRSFQMKNLFMKLTKNPECHPLVRAIWWAHELEENIFDTPAPLWSADKTEMDEYFDRYREEWEEIAASQMKKGQNWRVAIPKYKDKETQEKEKNSIAERSIVAPEAVPEQKWTWQE